MSVGNGRASIDQRAKRLWNNYRRSRVVQRLSPELVCSRQEQQEKEREACQRQFVAAGRWMLVYHISDSRERDVYLLVGCIEYACNTRCLNVQPMVSCIRKIGEKPRGIHIYGPLGGSLREFESCTIAFSLENRTSQNSCIAWMLRISLYTQVYMHILYRVQQPGYDSESDQSRTHSTGAIIRRLIIDVVAAACTCSSCCCFLLVFSCLCTFHCFYLY